MKNKGSLGWIPGRYQGIWQPPQHTHIPPCHTHTEFPGYARGDIWSCTNFWFLPPLKGGVLEPQTGSADSSLNTEQATFLSLGTNYFWSEITFCLKLVSGLLVCSWDILSVLSKGQFSNSYLTFVTVLWQGAVWLHSCDFWVFGLFICLFCSVWLFSHLQQKQVHKEKLVPAFTQSVYEVMSMWKRSSKK